MGLVEGKVIRIFDNRHLVVDIGSEDGLSQGDTISVYSPIVEIRDPETQEGLGEYRKLKASVRADEIFPRFTVATPYSRRERITESPQELTMGLFRGRYKTVAGKLEVEPGETDPLPTGSAIAVGDHVEAEIATRQGVDGPASPQSEG
jgi:hypothetical protein